MQLRTVHTGVPVWGRCGLVVSWVSGYHEFIRATGLMSELRDKEEGVKKKHKIIHFRPCVSVCGSVREWGWGSVCAHKCRVCIPPLREALILNRGISVNNLATCVNTKVPDLLEGCCIHTHKWVCIIYRNTLMVCWYWGWFMGTLTETTV